MTNTVNGKTSYSTAEKNLQQQPKDWSHATQELLDSLPRAWTRGLLYFLIIFLGITLPWAMLSKVDETGTASGRLEPKGNTIRLDTPVAGTVEKIKAKEGDLVKTGQSLLELESELVKAELQQTKNKLDGQQNRWQQLKLIQIQLQLSLQTQQQQNQAQALEKQAQVNQAQQNLNLLTSAYHLRQEEKLSQVNQAQQTLQHSQTESHLAKIRLGTAQGEIKRYEQAKEEGIASETQVVEKEDIVQERLRILEQAKSDSKQASLRLVEQNSSYERTLKEGKSEIEQAKLRLKEQNNSYQSLLRSGKLAALKIQEQLKNSETEIATLTAEIAQTKSQIKSLEFQLSQRVLKAPSEGTIFNFPIKRPGAVLQPGNLVAEIAPQKAALILKAKMATTESGSLREGMPVKIKFDAYPFQEYGIVEGQLSKISPTTSEVSTPNGQSSVYDLEIALNQTCIPTQTDCVKLRPGETGTAEVIIRQRRIIDLILAPFKQLQNDGLKL